MNIEALKAEKEERKKQYMKAWRDANAEGRKAYMKEWKAKNAEKNAEYQKAYHAEYRTKPEIQQTVWERNLWKNYKLTPSEFNDLWAKQGGKCAVCNVHMAPRGRTSDAACVDHNHDTGHVRGLLCRGCNHGIGNLRDNPDVLLSAAIYLIDRGFYGKTD